MKRSTNSRDTELEAWADQLEVDPADPQLLRGDAARAAGRELLDKVARRGSQPLDPTMAKGAQSPRRQVRLPQTLSDDLDRLAAAQQRAPSALMRDAIAEYVAARTKAS